MIKPERKVEIYQFISDKLIAADIPRNAIDNFDDKLCNIRINNGFSVPMGGVIKDLLAKYKWFLDKDNPVSCNSSHLGYFEININYRK